VGLFVFWGCEEFVEGVDNGSSEVAEAFCRVEACKGRAVDRALVAGGFRWSVVCSGNGGGLIEKASTEVFW
jgi:hypothetical protein